MTSQQAGVRRVALVHDYLLVMRGAERTFASISDLYHGAPISTLLYDETGTQGRFSDHQIATSPLQDLPISQRNFRALLPLYPWAIRRLAVPECNVVLSSSSAFAHGVRVPPGAVHICYCHAPFRYAWNEQARALAEVPAVLRPLLRRQLNSMRRWDLSASKAVDFYIANSQLTRDRIERFYRREATIIHPPVETRRFSLGQPGEALLVVSEIVRHKRVQLALESARLARVPIRVVGSGPDHAQLRREFPEAEFLGRVSDEDLARLYASARALVVPSIEEFGISAVEAQAAGRPVIAAAAGGALETVVGGETGLLVTPDDVDAFARAISSLESLNFSPARAVQNADRFSVAAFQSRLAAEIDRVA